ncbi:hypothetical protein G3M48_002338 [Beauveria asiatica]|uniref:Uncharacterized protein n=1 Tax=Beauveria asiatica TaxID=1069075 RepID=A0AAW0RYP5_9HYPO
MLVPGRQHPHARKGQRRKGALGVRRGEEHARGGDDAEQRGEQRAARVAAAAAGQEQREAVQREDGSGVRRVRERDARERFQFVMPVSVDAEDAARLRSQESQEERERGAKRPLLLVDGRAAAAAVAAVAAARGVHKVDGVPASEAAREERGGRGGVAREKERGGGVVVGPDEGAAAGEQQKKGFPGDKGESECEERRGGWGA